MGFSRKKDCGGDGTRRVLEGCLEGDGRQRSRDRCASVGGLKDEMGTNTSLCPLYGWAAKGEGARWSVPHNRGPNTTLLANCMNVEGMGPCLAMVGPTRREVFEAYASSRFLGQGTHRSDRLGDLGSQRSGCTRLLRVLRIQCCNSTILIAAVGPELSGQIPRGPPDSRGVLQNCQQRIEVTKVPAQLRRRPAASGAIGSTLRVYGASTFPHSARKITSPPEP
jgi:hypothetical protein